MPSLVAESASGAAFGAALLISGVHLPDIIKAQMLFTNTHMLQVFLGGSATSAIVLDIAHRWELVKKQHRPPSTLGLFAYDGNALGGALVGLGMATTGACPGTAMVQLAAAMTNGALVVLGGILGAAVFLKLKPVSEARRAQDSTAASAVATDSPADRQTAPAVAVAAKSCDIPTALSIQPLTMLLLWIPMCIGIILAAQAIDRPYGHFAGPVSPQFGGLLIGTAQAATVLLTHHHIGTSAAYEDVARWVAHKWSSSPSQGTQAPKITTPSLAFAAGIVCSSAILSRLLATHLPTTEPFTPSLPLIARTLVGGASMVFGARLAGGCTSGHGISGLAKFSMASLVTTCAIFGGGIISAQMLGT